MKYKLTTSIDLQDNNKQQIKRISDIIPVILGNAARHFDLEPIECISTT